MSDMMSSSPMCMGQLDYGQLSPPTKATMAMLRRGWCWPHGLHGQLQEHSVTSSDNVFPFTSEETESQVACPTLLQRKEELEAGSGPSPLQATS